MVMGDTVSLLIRIAVISDIHGNRTALEAVPHKQVHSPMALVHACPESLWRASTPEAEDAELDSVYRPLGQPAAVYAHIHRSYIRNLAGMTVVNTDSVSLSYDGDPRAAYLLLEDFEPAIRRIEYDIDREIQALTGSGLPHADWIAKTLQNACFQMP